MRNIFYFIAAVIAFGAAFFYYQDVSQQTATVQKLRLVAEDGLTIEAGTVIDDDFMDTYVVSQEMPRALAAEFEWALDDTAVTRINLRDQVFGQDVTGGSFLQRGHFFVDQQQDFALRIREGYRAFSIPVATDRAVENFLNPGSLVDVVGAFEITPKVFESRILL
ncbi:MAG: RcpC/CpaB family pilus assembly protein, partial [Pseudomonadota bacterium]